MDAESTRPDDSPTQTQVYLGAGLKPGTRLGHYEIQSHIGAGGCGRVYLAQDTVLHRPVAVKILLRGAAAGETARKRFAREASAASALNHPNIVTVYEIGREQEMDYIAMEYIAGKALRERIPKDGLDPSQLFAWAIQIAGAVAAAHDAGVIHRDLKPGNVMITERGVAKVVDFGLAKTLPTEGTDRSDEPLTAEGVAVGTCAYMAPEQAERGVVDRRSDIFSFGCVLYEMATGRKAFEGASNLSTLAAVIHKDPPELRSVSPQVPEGLAAIVAQCLRKDPNDRWQNMGDVNLLLEQARRNWEAGAVKTAAARRPWWHLAAAAMAGAAVVGGLLWYRADVAPAPDDARITMLTTDGGLSAYPSLSSDGSLAAFSSDRSGEGNMDIWLQQIGGAAPIRLTHDPADETDPDLSPDGTRVVFRSEKEGGGIYSAPALGGEPTLVAQGGKNPRFSPDGKWIAYWVGREGRRLVAGPGAATVYIVPAGGGQPRELGRDLVGALIPVWSPSGESVIVLGQKNVDPMAALPDWWVLPVSGGPSRATNARRILQKQGLEAPVWQYNPTPARWLADEGGEIVFAAQSADTVNLWKLSIDERSGRTHGRAVRITSGAGYETGATFAAMPGRERMAFASVSLNFDLWAIPIDAESGVERGELRRLTQDASFKFFPSMSWDGKLVSYTAHRIGADSLCILDLGTGKESTLLSNPAGILTPLISGNGQWIVFTRESGDVARISTRGGTVAQLCTGCGTPMDVSFDGNRVILEPPKTPEGVDLLDASTGRVTTLVPPAGQLYGGKLSHDGKWVTFQAITGAHRESQIFTARVENGHVADRAQWITLAEPDSGNATIGWSPGGSVFYFLSDRDGFRCVWARKVEPETKKPIGPLFGVHHFHHSRHSMQWHQSMNARVGQTLAANMIVLSLGDLTGNVWMEERRLK